MVLKTRNSQGIKLMINICEVVLKRKVYDNNNQFPSDNELKVAIVGKIAMSY